VTLLLAEAKGIAEHALGGPVHDAVTALRCINEAGHWLCNIRPWRWLRGGLEALAFVADQDYADLPADFGALIALEGGRGFSNSIALVTLEELLERKAQSAGGTASYYCAVVTYDHADITGTSAGGSHAVTATTAATAAAKKRPTPRLEIFPTPTAAATDGALVYYTRGWREVTEDQDTIFVPDWMESVYLRALRCWVRGYEEEDTYPKDEAMAMMVGGPEFRGAVKRDAQMQMLNGPIRGGAAQGGWDQGRQSRLYGVIANP
jgi:hypothetical protein